VSNIIKKKRKNQKSNKLFINLRTGWQSRYPVLLFVCSFGILMAIFYGMWLSKWFALQVHPKVFSLNANFSSMILNLFRENTSVKDATIYSSSFSMNIGFGCDAVEAMALFTCGLLAFPSKWKIKIVGLISGLTILFFLNIIRVITLYLTGVYYHEVFDLLHLEVWQVVFIAIAITLWMLWLREVLKAIKPA